MQRKAVNMADPISFGYSDSATNTDTFGSVYKINFNTNTNVVSSPLAVDLGVGGQAIMSDNQFGSSTPGSSTPVTGSTLSNDYEAVSEFVRINGTFKDYLDTTYGSGNWSATYTGFSTVDAVERVLLGSPDVNNGLDQPIISINFGPNIPSPPPNFEGGLDYFVLSSQAVPPTDGGIAEFAPYYYSCFEKNTLISTSKGDLPVHQIGVGDFVLNQNGEAVEVLWVGRQVLNPAFAKVHGAMPVKLTTGSLGNGLPQADLYVSPDHAFLIDGLLVNASALVNGNSIVQVQSWTSDLEYYHIETDSHEIILAQGAPAETYLDNEGRQKFMNYAEFQSMYPAGKAVKELDLPRIKHARQLPNQIKKRLAEQAVNIGLGLQEVA